MIFTKTYDFSENHQNHENDLQNHWYSIGLIDVFTIWRKIKFLVKILHFYVKSRKFSKMNDFLQKYVILRKNAKSWNSSTSLEDPILMKISEIHGILWKIVIFTKITKNH